ncbi:Hypothetical protein PHPALM_9705 [Phytophthora palmivora]|uniref:HTH CENPB-type domain-containing protein n=1 Tax=Phytophthora palmivora TaxID=4796 RepID=A0A2P4Y6L6_9STRA|nr:Hypothetical protein PHPALM_9705 [Phytophthora palmivora]
MHGDSANGYTATSGWFGRFKTRIIRASRRTTTTHSLPENAPKKDVNHTGMWNDDILLEHAKAVVSCRMETQLYREPTLYLINSYACHVLLAGKKNKSHSIFVFIVPPNLVNSQQPLDAYTNRSYQ